MRILSTFPTIFSRFGNKKLSISKSVKNILQNKMSNKNLKLIFIRHGKLSLPYKSHAEMPMNVLSDLALKKIDPSIDRDFAKEIVVKLLKKINLCDIDVIYVSPSRRCKETAKFIIKSINLRNKKIPVIVSRELKEATFYLDKIYKDEKKFNFKTLNKNVLNAMITGIGSESAKVMQNRVDRFINKIKNNENKKVVIISHDFIMRVVEIYLKNGGNLKNITRSDLKKTQKNDYFCGFNVDGNFKKIRQLIF